jgi:C-terminal processing protease CtpA/Prc
LREVAPCYRIFGLDERATFSEVKLAYRKLVKQYHPDLVSNKDRSIFLADVEKLKKLNSAYNYLRHRHRHIEKRQDRYLGWLGFSITMGKLNNNSCPVVSHVSECSPAALTGLCVDDHIIDFNDRSTLGMTRREIVNLFSGKAGIPVKMKVYRRSKHTVYTLYAIRLTRPD